jgi:hypothetical protein
MIRDAVIFLDRAGDFCERRFGWKHRKITGLVSADRNPFRGIRKGGLALEQDSNTLRRRLAN